MRRLRVEGGLALILMLAGLALVIAGAAGAADTLQHGRADIGTGLAGGRYKQVRCYGRPTGCSTVRGVHIRVDRSGVVVPVPSDALYALVGSGSAPVRLKLDTFNDRISDVQARGRWYVTYDSGKTTLYIVTPLILIGLFCVAITAVPLARATGRAITARRRGWRWAWAVLGSLLFAFCVALSITGLTGDRYDIGQGELFDRYATNGSLGYREGVHVHVDLYGTDEKVESRELFALAEPGARVPVGLQEDSAGELAAVTHDGTTYVVQPPSWIALFGVVPVGLFALALAWRNGRELWRSRARPAPVLP